MFSLAILIASPLLAGLLCLPSNSMRLHRAILMVLAALLGLGCVALAMGFPSPARPLFFFASFRPDLALLALEVVLAAVLIGIPLRARRFDIAFLALLSGGLSLGGHFLGAGHPEAGPQPSLLLVDGLSLIMVLIVAVIGGLIAIHAVGYMEDYRHHHPEGRDRRGFFFFVIGLFLSAMMGLVVVNHLGWLFACWEVTTLCSFLLIGFSQTEEARRNAFHALRLNIVGGVAFAAALFLMEAQHMPPLLSTLVPALGNAVGDASNPWKAAAMLPIALLAFAGLTKSAQFPFSSWLLGAMVAPSPVSALLHSSTMVKAGVYLIIRIAPPLQHTRTGLVLSLIGAITFLIASFLAVPQRNAKRVLAYSTIANLGLIVACAGAGTQQALWAAILLLIFHAVAKALLFLAVGTVEHQIGSRDIEDMQGLLVRRPGLAVVMLIGMAGMFLAPFGMLVSKWAALEALVQVSLLLPLLVAFGSAATLFFWSKWMGKLISQPAGAAPGKHAIHGEETIALVALAVMTVALCGGYPLLSHALIEPMLASLFGGSLQLGPSVLWIMPMMLVTVMLLPCTLLLRGSRLREVEPYMGGANTLDRDRFVGSRGLSPALALKNYYLTEVFPEATLSQFGVVACASLSAVMIVLVIF